MIIQQGVHDISNEDYHASEGISRSGIMEFKKTPYHYWQSYLNPERPPRDKKDTDATILGSAYHTLILEPSEFEKRYAVKVEKEILPKTQLQRVIGKEAYAEAKIAKDLVQQKNDRLQEEFEKSSYGKEILTPKVYENILAMQDKLRENKQALALIEGAQYEKSIYWTDPHTGLLCKSRPDIWHSNMVSDLKTADDACSRKFQSSLYDCGYYIQAGMICEGLRHALGIDMRNFIYITQEKKYPYAIAIYQLDEMALEQGIAEFKNSLLKIKQCMEKNEWPSYKAQVITLPAYAKST